jgi:hypothetical protein
MDTWKMLHVGIFTSRINNNISLILPETTFTQIDNATQTSPYFAYSLLAFGMFARKRRKKPLKLKSMLKTLSLGIVASLCLATQCKKEPLDQLPPETQTGANTFGCLVNGELFVKARGNPMGNKPLMASFGYIGEIKSLRIECRAANAEFRSIDLFIDNPREGMNVLSRAEFYPEGVGRNCASFCCQNCGQVFITRFDTINWIVSGRFEFSGRCGYFPNSGEPPIYTGDTIVHITQGRFDVKF